MAERDYHKTNSPEKEEAQPQDIQRGIYQRVLSVVLHPIETSKTLLDYINDHNPLDFFQGPHSH